MRVSLVNLAERFGGELRGIDAEATGFATDNRAVVPGDVFIAIKGANVDGHDFVADAISRGAVAALVEKPVQENSILVPDVIAALANYARSYRAEFTGPVIGITGSAGKTTTKEFLAAACATAGHVVKTEGNRNSEFTSPLLWADVTPETRVVIAEMGMRGFGQIAHLAKMHQPTIGLITNVGYSHSELVGGREGIAAAKGELLTELPSVGVAVLYSEDEYLGNLISLAGERKIRTFGLGGNADCQVTGYEAIDWHSSRVEGVLDGQKWSATMPTVGRHIATNVAAAILAATEAGVSLEEAAAGIQNAQLPPLRMDIREYKGATLVMDNYNASPPAVLGAIQTLEEVPCDGQRYVVLGTMRELGDDSREAHLAVGRRLSRAKVDRIIVFGEETEYIVSDYLRRGGDAAKVAKVESLDEIRQQLSGVASGDAILVKGSRALELEKVFE